MKLRFATLITIMSVYTYAGFGQRTMRTEAKPSASTASSHAEVANEGALARRSLALHSGAQAERFRQVAVALNLTSRQKNSIGSLIQQTRQQLSAVNGNGSLTQEQQRQAEQAIKLGLAQKVVGLLTPEQKDDLQALLLKKKQQQNANSSGGNSGGSAPEIPSVDAPSGTDSSDSEDQSSAQNVNNGNSDTSANSSTTASTSSDTGASGGGSPAAGKAVSASTAPPNAPQTQIASVKADAASSISANAKPHRLSDAQLATILNSFVQDGSEGAATKSATPSASSTS